MHLDPVDLSAAKRLHPREPEVGQRFGFACVGTHLPTHDSAHADDEGQRQNLGNFIAAP